MSARVCSTCGKESEKLYGGEGRYPVECLDCWIAGQERESEIAEAILANRRREAAS